METAVMTNKEIAQAVYGYFKQIIQYYFQIAFFKGV